QARDDQRASFGLSRTVRGRGAVRRSLRGGFEGACRDAGSDDDRRLHQCGAEAGALPAGAELMAKLGLIAGGGDLPRRLAEHLRASGRGVFVLALKGFADPGLAAEFNGAEAAMGQLGKGLKLLKDAGCDEVAFAGTVKRPDFSALQVDMRGAALLPEILVAAAKGGDAIVRVVLGACEEEGLRVVGAGGGRAALLAPAGPVGRHSASGADWADIREAAREAASIGLEDVGQGAVARSGKIIDSEKQDGTDAMLRRVATLGGRGGVLVKRPKPQQERR